MKGSFGFRHCLPAALAVGSLVGCAHGRNAVVQAAPPRPSGTLTAEDIERAPGVPLEQLIVAKVPGVMLTPGRDGRMVMHIRGITTLDDQQDPLFVVNGLPLGNAANFAAIDRSDIESIEVLRDPASTAAYGIRGANGVIVVKTKGS